MLESPAVPEISKLKVPSTVSVPEEENFFETVSTAPASTVTVPPDRMTMSRAEDPFFSVRMPFAPTVQPVTEAPAATSTFHWTGSGIAASQPVMMTVPCSATASDAASSSAKAS